ncbi:MAG: glycosyltransferase family 39 protein [Chloroflexi bacterium]|nr:glycosyltransferase family 39 protein [Chloroflexota bacterium]
MGGGRNLDSGLPGKSGWAHALRGRLLAPPSPVVVQYSTLALILCLAGAVRRRYFFGMVRPDSFDYAADAAAWLQGFAVFTPDANAFHVVRLSVLAPVTLIYGLLGISELTSALWPLFCSLGSVGLAYAIGKLLFGPRTGLLAALVVAIYPLEVVYATKLLPDTTVGFFVGLSVYFFLKAELASRPLARHYFLAGVAVGLSYYARLNAPVIVLFFGAYLLWRRRLSRAHFAFVPGVLAVFIAAGLVFQLAGGGFFYDLEMGLRPLRESANRAEWTVPSDPALYYQFTQMLLTNGLFAPWTLALAGSLVYLGRRSPRDLIVPLLWLGALFLYFELLSQWPVRSVQEKEDRYLSPLVLPLALIVGHALADGLKRMAVSGHARSVLVTATVVCLVGGLAVQPIVDLRIRFTSWETRYPRYTAVELKRLPSKPVYVSASWINQLNFFLGYRHGLQPNRIDDDTRRQTRLRRVKLVDGRPADLSDVYVVHDRRYGLLIPPEWRHLTRIDNVVDLYYVPPSSSARDPA